MQAPEKNQVIKAINELGRKVTAADVAAKTGLPLHVATTQLNHVAAETNGHLQVATTGDIAYGFDLGFQNAYLAKGIQRTLQIVGEKAFQIGFYLLRISFGIMLVLSLLAVVALIVVAIIAINQGRDSDGGRDGGGFNLDFFDFMILRDLLWWGSYSSYETYPRTIGYHEPTYIKRHDGNFLLDCFSFLFGDGDPNLGLEERRWQLIAEVIRENNGVVTAEQLAPYTGADPKKEDGALPALVRFNGRPEVTDIGNIVYVFPSLQVSATARYDAAPPKFFQEWRWQFSHVPFESLIPVYLLAGVNFLGSGWLFLNMNSIAVLSDFAPLINVLMMYGSLFVGVPVARYLVINVLNSGIVKRNEQRNGYAQLLTAPAPELEKKLLEAKQFQIAQQKISSDKIVYTTDKDVLEQEFDASP